jgi:prophage tail gpP-like protein
MATFTSDTRGGIDDRVRITLGNSEALVVERYTVKQSFLTQPSTFSLSLGHAGVVRELLQRFPPGTPYTLSIGTVLQQTGRVDDQDATGDANGSSVTLTGRDALAPLIDARITADKSYTNATYADLVQAVLRESLGAGATLLYTNEQNRSTQAGTTIVQSDLPIDPVGVRTAASKERPIQAKVGELRYKFLRDQLDRAGLFLNAAADGRFILSAPNASQPPVARIVRGRGESLREGNVKSFRYRNATSGRFSRCTVHGRGGGGKDGRQNFTGEYVDQEMVGWGFDRPLCARDPKCATASQAETITRRKIAESRRSGWSLIYTLAGHTTPRINGRDRVVWAVDTVVEVDDQEIGVAGTFWVESVEFSRGPETNTTITLMRPEDLVFGGEDA